ncbi:hypothetical protein CEG15_17830 [Vibrio anguillarum]|nr:hypothetical protein CEG15_17830 [Vibrio anguillarum]
MHEASHGSAGARTIADMVTKIGLTQVWTKMSFEKSSISNSSITSGMEKPLSSMPTITSADHFWCYLYLNIS